MEFLSHLRSDVEACHRPCIDEILENIFHIADMEEGQAHAPECVYIRPSDSGILKMAFLLFCCCCWINFNLADSMGV